MATTSTLPPSYTIAEFCAAERFTRPYYHKLKREGRGPREMRDGRLVRISHKARLDWQKMREQLTDEQVEFDAKLHERALVAGAAAAASPKHISKRRSAR